VHYIPVHTQPYDQALGLAGGDLDLLVDPSAEASLLDIARIQVELERHLGVSVDVLTPKALPDQFRDRVLREARSI